MNYSSVQIVFNNSFIILLQTVKNWVIQIKQVIGINDNFFDIEIVSGNSICLDLTY